MSASMLACAAFLALAVYGWGLSLKTVGVYLLSLLALLGVIVGLAFLSIFLLQHIKRVLKK